MNQTKYSTPSLGCAALVALSCSACATSQPPSELLLARSAYQTAQNGAAWDYNPGGLRAAELALQDAEASFADDGASEETRSAAALALRRAQQAEYKGEQASLRAAERTVAEELEEHEREGASLHEPRSDSPFEDETPGATEPAGAEGGLTRTYIEPGALPEAEGITLRVIPHGSLFDSDMSSVRDGARPELEEVANALRMQPEAAEVVIVGHADAQGPDSYNLQLSRARAETIASFLVERGVPRENISTLARGEREPIASDATPRGRALNRRIDVTIKPLGDEA